MLTSGERVREGERGEATGIITQEREVGEKLGVLPHSQREKVRETISFFFSPANEIGRSLFLVQSNSLYLSLFRGIKFVKEELSGKPHPRRAPESSPIFVT